MIAVAFAVILAVFEVILVFNPLSAFVALVVSAVILAILAFTLLVKVSSAALAVVASAVIAVVFAVMLIVFDATVIGKPAIVEAVMPPTLFTVVAKLPFPDPVTSPVKVVIAFAAITLVPITKPKFVLASEAVVAPVPPLFNVIVVPLQTPDVMVPTVVISVPINLSAVILPANFALVILRSATPALALCKSTYVFTAFCEGYKRSLGLVLPKSVAVLLLLLASAPSVVKAPIAVDVPVPPFTIDTIPVTFAELPVILPEGVA